jgi:hypothetical protein
MRVTAAGRKIVDSRTRKRMSRPRKRNREKPYATTTQERSVPAVPMRASMTVLKSSLGKSMISHASEKFSQWGANSHGRSSARQDPCQVIGSASGAAGSMKTLSWRPCSRIASSRVVPSGSGTR